MNVRKALKRILSARASWAKGLRSVGAALVALLSIHYASILRWRRLKKLPPGPLPIPLLGNLLLLKTDDVAAEFAPLFKKYGPVFSFWFGEKLAIVENDPSVEYELMVTRVDQFNARPKTEAERMINYEAGKCEGIHSSEGQQWANVRKVLVSDLLSKNNLEVRILPKVMTGSRALVKHLAGLSGRVISPRMLLKITAMNASLKLVLDSEISYDDLGTYDARANKWHPPERELSKAAQMAFFFFRYIDVTFTCLAAANVRDVMPWPLSAIIPRPTVFAEFFKLAKERDALWEEVIADHRATRTSGAPRDWVDEILDNPRGLKDEEIIGLLMDTVIATSDTFIAFIEWLLAMVAQKPEEQTKLQEELDKVAPDRLIEAKDQSKCPYFVAFMKEIFRMCPLTPINPPRRAIVDSELAGYCVPKDTWVFQHWGAMGAREDLWKDPENFRPQRFLEEAQETGDMAMNIAAPKKPCNLSVFAFGKRSCPGYRLGRVSAFVQSAMMIQLFDWKLCEDSDLKPEPRLIVFPKSFKAVATYRHKIPIEELLAKPADCTGAWL